MTAKQKVAPMQGQEVKKLTERIEDYDLRQREARAKYQGMRWDHHSSILLGTLPKKKTGKMWEF